MPRGSTARCNYNVVSQRAPIKFQSNGSQRAIHTVFVHVGYRANNTRNAAIRYMPIRGRGNCLRATARFLCTELPTYDRLSRYCNDQGHIGMRRARKRARITDYRIRRFRSSELRDRRDIRTEGTRSPRSRPEATERVSGGSD